MDSSLPASPVPPAPVHVSPGPIPVAPRAVLGRLATDRVTYLAVFGFLLLYVFSVKGLETLLQRHFRSAVAEAAAVEPSGDVAAEVAARVDRVIRESLWVRPGGVRIDALVLAADGRTLLYAGGALAGALAPWNSAPAEPRPLLPPRIDVVVSVAHNSLVANGILVGYASLLLGVLFGTARRLERQQEQRVAEAVAARDRVAERAARIEGELEAVRQRLSSAETGHASDAEEIRELESERGRLMARLGELERREAALRSEGGSQLEAIQSEHRALEELLEEAVSEMRTKEDEIRSLQQKVRKQERSESAPARAAEALGKRLRTLYKNLEIDDRAVQDVIDLRDDSLALRAEESLKRLCDDPEQAQVRRKVGGLPPHLSIFELGFGGGGRIYFTKGRVRRHRILLVGTKATQKPDLEYLSRLPKE
jgi:hypothetical protein